MATNYLLKRYFKREFGTYLDDPDSEQTGLPPGIAKVCLRCGSPFQAFRNDAHVAGFCSQGCRDRFAADKVSR